jgi:putative Ig domain-containing protein
MRFRSPAWGTALVCASMILVAIATSDARAATVAVPAGGNLQAALNAAQPGDVITLAPGATYVGNFVLPNKGAIAQAITVRSAAADAQLPAAGIRITPAYAAMLPKIKSPNSAAALRAAPGANHWTLTCLEFQANQSGYGEIVTLGTNDSAQTMLSQVPYQLVLDRVYIHGDPVQGQKRGLGLNSSATTIVNSYVSDIKAVGQDSQAIAGFNGPGQYVIENNYLEAATENFLLGGADPMIPNLVTTGVTFRYNYLSKPLSWRDPIIATPTGAAARAAAGGGTLAAGTYYYTVVARVVSGQGTKASSSPSAEVSATLAAGTSGGVTISWTPIAGATDYMVYGRTTGKENMSWKTTVPFYVDTGVAGAAGSAGGTTKWAVKNIFELKNAQDVLVEGNVFENLWVADQPGYPIVFTPRNQSGTAPWVVLQRVTFRNNIIRHTAGGVNILGTDNVNPSQRTNHITISNNVFDDMTSATWGSGARALQLGDGPDAIVIDHNTLITTDTIVLSLYGGSATAPTPSTNVAYSNNASRHNTYGIFGASFSSGTASINAYLPGGVVDGNVLAGGTASKYPTGNFFPTTAAWQAGFVDYAGGDYHLLAASGLKGAGTDGKDPGADIDLVAQQTANAVSGDNSVTAGTSHVQITTTILPDGMVNQAYAQTLTCTGGSSRCAWQVVDSRLPAGINFDPLAAVLIGTPTSVETGSMTVEAFDPASPTNCATKTLILTVAPPQFVVTMPDAPGAQVGVAYRIAPTVGGAMGSPSWSVVSGALPTDLVIDAQSGVIAGTPVAWGTSTAVVQAEDSWGTDRVNAQPVTITVAPAALIVVSTTLANGMYHQAYQAALVASGGSGATTWSVAAGPLPGGVALDANGALSGVPTSIGTFVLTVRAADANWPGNVATATVTLTIDSPSFAASMTAALIGRVGLPYQIGATASGAVGSVAWSIASGMLPAGLALDAATGVIAGVPAVSGSFNAVVQARDSWNGRVASVSATIVIAPMPLRVTTTTLASSTVRASYQAALAATGGTGSTTWSIVDRALPDGLALGANGLITGSPTTAGTASFTVKATDAGWPDNAATQTLAIAIAEEAGVLPSPWAQRDLGSVGVAGTARLADGTFTVTGSGSDIWGGGDAFHFVYQPWTGDGSIVARIASVTTANNWSKAGVMFRQTLSGGSAHAVMLVSAAKGTAFQRRRSSGADSVSTTGSSSAAPRWVRLERSGNLFSAFESADGINWTFVGSDTIAMAQQIFVGLAVTSHDNTRSTTAAISVTVAVPSFTASAPAAPPGQVGQPYRWAATATGQIGAVAWSVASGALPAGVSIDAVSAAMSGIPSASGAFNAVVRASDSLAGRVADVSVAIIVAPTQVVIATPALAAAKVGTAYEAGLFSAGGTGSTAWSIVAGTLPAGLALGANGVISGTPTTAGLATFTVQAVDAGWTGNTATQEMTIAVATGDVVLYGTDAAALFGTWSLVADPTAAGGSRLSNPDHAAPKVNAPLASPANYVELSFQAQAGVAYHFWMRGKADKNSWANDSVYVQFSQAANAAGAPLYRIGTTSATTVSIERTVNAGLSGWGWTDNAMGDLAAPIYFAVSGPQTIRIQVREDGLSIDQIVLSADKYFTVAPGSAKNDATIVSR